MMSALALTTAMQPGSQRAAQRALEVRMPMSPLSHVARIGTDATWFSHCS